MARLRPAWRARLRLVGGATSVSLPCRYVETHDRLAHASPARRIAVVVRWSSSAAKTRSCRASPTIPPGPALAREPMARNLRALMRAQYRQDHRCTAQHAVALDAPTVVPASRVEYLSCLRAQSGGVRTSSTLRLGPLLWAASQPSASGWVAPSARMAPGTGSSVYRSNPSFPHSKYANHCKATTIANSCLGLLATARSPVARMPCAAAGWAAPAR
jgi:hypothetical protein